VGKSYLVRMKNLN